MTGDEPRKRPDNIDKLPKWAQEYIQKIERERENAVRALNDMVDSYTESHFSYTELVVTGEDRGPSYKKRYIQTRAIDVNHAGVHLRILVRPDDRHIEVSYESEASRRDTINFIPTGFQQFELEKRY